MSALAVLAESRILEALEEGEDRHLEGMGQPMDMEAYFAAPSGVRAGFGLLKSAGVVPPEVEAMREVQQLRERVAAAADPVLASRLRQELRTREVELALGLERMKRALMADAAL